MQRKLFLASGNQHKIAEFREILGQELPEVELVNLQERPELAREVAETGASYQANALLKARAYAKLIDLPVITDDSGVEVLALPGLLGVYSARWVAGSDADRMRALLERLGDQTERRLIYHAVICYLAPGEEPRFFAGELRGRAALSPSGEMGFGYDPIMIPEGLEQTLSELGRAEKNAISHRRRAIDQLVKFLQSEE